MLWKVLVEKVFFIILLYRERDKPEAEGQRSLGDSDRRAVKRRGADLRKGKKGADMRKGKKGADLRKGKKGVLI